MPGKRGRHALSPPADDQARKTPDLRASCEELQENRLDADLLLDRVVIYGRRRRQPAVSEAFSHLAPSYGGSVRCATVDIGDRRRCTRTRALRLLGLLAAE